jgi:hypothetical protein
MIAPISMLYLLISAVTLAVGFKLRSFVTLFFLSVFWWLGAFVSAYFVFLAWIDQSYSENWAMLGFVFLALPYATFTVVLILIVLYFTRSWSGKQAKLLQLNLLVLFTFLALQMIAGFISA